MSKFYLVLLAALTLGAGSNYAFAAKNKNKTIYFNAWAGNEKINQFIQSQAADYQPALKKIQAEKASGNIDNGSIDVLWINHLLSIKGHPLKKLFSVRYPYYTRIEYFFPVNC